MKVSGTPIEDPSESEMFRAGAWYPSPDLSSLRLLWLRENPLGEKEEKGGRGRRGTCLGEPF